MPEPVGLSFLYPAVPILCAFSMFLLLLLVPSFWKTRIFALYAFLGWLFLGDLLVFIGMVQWRGNIHNAPVWADLLAALNNILGIGTFTTSALFAKFVALRLRPLSGRELVDSRRKHNRIDVFFSVGLPLLWIPTFLLSCSGRYYIVEDIGPVGAIWIDAWGFVLVVVPVAAAAVAIAIFNVMGLVRYWRGRRGTAGSEISERAGSARTRKLLAMSFCNMLLALFAIGFPAGKFLQYYPVSEWGVPKSIAKNVEYLKIIRFMDRFFLDTYGRSSVDTFTSHHIATPLMGVYFFAWFGFGKEARKSYRVALESVSGLFGFRSQVERQTAAEACSPSWRSKLVPKGRPNRGGGSLPTMATITPFAVSSLNAYNTRLSSKHAASHRSSSDATSFDSKGERRQNGGSLNTLSLSQTSPTASSTPSHAATDEPENTPPRGSSFHKPSLPAPSAARLVEVRVQEPIPAADPRRLSCHKPLFPVAPAPEPSSGSHMSPFPRDLASLLSAPPTMPSPLPPQTTWPLRFRH